MTTLLKTTTQTSRRLERLVQLIDTALERALRPAPGSPPVLHEAMRYCVFSAGAGRGTVVQRPKRFRPLLCLGGAEAVGGSPRAALPVACAVELIHTYSLVHDDLPAMDNAEERRGQPSCHKRFGEATAILVGDALLTKAFAMLGDANIPTVPAILKALGEAGGTAGLIGGQVLDLECGMRKGECGINELEEVARRKTAALITASVVAGGLSAGASAQDLSRLRRYGERVGLAFQLMDDLHDQDGLARVQGEAAVRCQAERLLDQATRELAPFGRRARSLRELAEWLSRT